MALPSSGAISLLDIQTEFGGPIPISLNAYYRGGSYITTNDYAPNVPSSGAISLNQFYGSKKNTFNGINFTSTQYFTIPSTSNGILNVYVIGGGGSGGMHSDYWGGYGGDAGRGGIASQTISITPGGTYYVEVGGGATAGHYGYGYPNNPFADGYSGGGGGQSSFAGVIAGGGGGGSGGSPSVSSGGAGGGGYGGAGGTLGYWRDNSYYDKQGYHQDPNPYADANTKGSDGGGTGDYLGWGPQGAYGFGGQGGRQSHDNSGGSIWAYNGPTYANGTQGIVCITGWW
jgi:hypothetical protein